MKKKRYLLPIIPILSTVATTAYPVGWPMPSDITQNIARILFWVSLSAIPLVSVFAYWDKIRKLIPIRIRIEGTRKTQKRRLTNNAHEESINAMAEQINNLTSELKPYRDILSEQRGHEEQWLRPVIEWIDFNRTGLTNNRIVVKYQIDSGLLYPFQPHRMWIKPVIGDWQPHQGKPHPEEEIIPPPNLSPCARTQLASLFSTVSDEGLLKRIESCRRGEQMKQTLNILVQLRPQESIKTLGGSYSITPL